MSARWISVCGVGTITDSAVTVNELCGPYPAGIELPRVEVLDAGAVEGKDRITQLAIRAGHQAWKMAGMDDIDGESVGLVFVSAWGTIESTAAYLESMLAEQGRYASPRHFSRSVFSSVASAMAIHFGIHGPCETLAFDVALVEGALMRAWRLLAARRCQRVMVVWADERGEIAKHLAHQALKILKKKQYSRYAERGLGEGAVALVLGEAGLKCGVLDRIEVQYIARGAAERSETPDSGMPFATDEAVRFLRRLLSGINPP